MKRHVWILATGLATLWVAASVRSSDSEETARPNRLPRERSERPQEAPPRKPLPAPEEPASAPKPETVFAEPGALSLPPSSTPPLELREWILSLTDREFEPLIGTATLDTYVNRVVVALSMDRPEPELHAFMAHLNARIQSLRRD